MEKRRFSRREFLKIAGRRVPESCWRAVVSLPIPQQRKEHPLKLRQPQNLPLSVLVPGREPRA